MSPVNQKQTLKRSTLKRKQERKKWKRQKLFNVAVCNGNGTCKQSELNHDEEHYDENLKSSSAHFVNGNRPIPQNIGPSYTISIAVPSSILDNAQSPELRTYLAEQIARAACIYCVDEIVVYDDKASENNGIHKPGGNSCSQMCRLLQYLECPQYLRKQLFPLHKDLKYAGILNPLDAPHHLRQSDVFPFREGVVSHRLLKQGKGSYVNVGLFRDIFVNKSLVPGVRVTVKLLPLKDGSKKRFGLIVPPAQPREELGVYWGYTVRVASSLGEVFSKGLYDGGYDLTIGTSDKGIPIETCQLSIFTQFKHVLIVFGGLEGLESALECDDTLTVGDVKLLFNKYLNTCVNQGSRTIRTEEAVLISLAQITTRINAASSNLYFQAGTEKG